MTITRKASFLAVCATVLLAAAPAAVAEQIIFVATGTFDATGTSRLDNIAGVDISFDTGVGLLDLEDGEFSFVTFGQFNTSLTDAGTPVQVDTGFTLNITQSAPTFDTHDFTGSISGRIYSEGSTLIMQFNGPLTFTTADGRVRYDILNADSGIPGRIVISAPNTNGGITSVNGQVTLVPIPEPSAFALMGLGLPALLLFRRRRAAA